MLSDLGRVRHVGGFGSGLAYKLITNVAMMAAEAGLREALDLTDVLGMDYATALDLCRSARWKHIVSRGTGHDKSTPVAPLRRGRRHPDLGRARPSHGPADFVACRQRLWEAVNATPGVEPDFVDLTRKTTARRGFRA